jgi:hypothetical protein
MKESPSDRLGKLDRAVGMALTFAALPVFVIALIFSPLEHATGLYCTAIFTAFLAYLAWPHINDRYVWTFLALSAVFDQIVQAIVRAETTWDDGWFIIFVISLLTHIPFYFLIASSLKPPSAQPPASEE